MNFIDFIFKQRLLDLAKRRSLLRKIYSSDGVCIVLDGNQKILEISIDGQQLDRVASALNSALKEVESDLLQSLQNIYEGK